MEKVEIGIYFCVTADILTKFYWNVSGVVLYQPHEFCPNNWFIGNRKAKFSKNKKNNKNKKKLSKI